MRAEYKRDMNHNYLILYGEKEIDTSSYQVRMLVGNGIPSLLNCRVQGIDGKFSVSYEITSRQSVRDLFEQRKFKAEDLQMVFGSFVHVMENMSEYLLNPGELVIQPEYLYVDSEKREVSFCYLPGYQKDVRRQFQELTEYVLPKLDHEDQQAVVIGYGVYRRALEDNFHLENIKEELYMVRKEESPFSADQMERNTELFYQKFTGKEQESDEKMPEKRSDYDYNRKEVSFLREEEANQPPDKKEPGKIIMCCLAALICTGILAAKLLGYLPGIELEAVLGIILAGMGCIMFIYLLISRKKRKEKPEMEQKENSSNETLRYSRHEQTGAEMAQHWEEREEQTRTGIFGETVILSQHQTKGPASLVSREPGELAAIYLEKELTVIGKLESSADALIDLPTVSRMHAKIRQREGEYYLADLNSRNGTSVNGQLLKAGEEHQLQDQDEVDFAQARYVFLK